jgi:hypothetical protein
LFVSPWQIPIILPQLGHLTFNLQISKRMSLTVLMSQISDNATEQ